MFNLKTPVLTEKAEPLQTDDKLPGEVQVLCDSKEKDFLSYLNLMCAT